MVKKENQCLKEIIFYTKITVIWIHGQIILTHQQRGGNGYVKSKTG